jgi:hypothetical protein
LEDNDVEDDTYMPSPWARPHGKGLASASSSRATRDEEEIEDEEDGGNGNDGAEGDDDEEDEEVFDIEEINPTFYIHMGTPVFLATPQLELERENQLQGQDRFGEGKEKRKFDAC